MNGTKCWLARFVGHVEDRWCASEGRRREDERRSKRRNMAERASSPDGWVVWSSKSKRGSEASEAIAQACELVVQVRGCEWTSQRQEVEIEMERRESVRRKKF